MTSYTFTKASLSQLSKNFNRFRNILLRYGDGSADQVFTAIVESRMGSRLLEEWKLHTNDKTAVPAGDELIEFCDQRELILSSTAQECNQDPRPQFYRPKFKSSPTSSNKKYSKSYFALHNVDVSNCRLCQTGDHTLYNCVMFKAQDPIARRKTLQSLQCCFNCPSVYKPTFVQGMWQQISHSPVPLRGC